MDYKKKYLKYKKKYINLKDNQNEFKNLSHQELQKTFDNLYNDTLNKIDAINYENDDIFRKKGYAKTYGELTKNGLESIMKNISGNIPQTFIDLGSGKGNVLKYASKYFKHVEGVELDKDRHNEALENIKGYNNIKITNGDLLEYPIKNKSVIYISSLCFNDKFLEKISRKLKNIPEGSYIYSSRQLPNFTKHNEFSVEQSWKQESNLYEYRK